MLVVDDVPRDPVEEEKGLVEDGEMENRDQGAQGGVGRGEAKAVEFPGHPPEEDEEHREQHESRDAGFREQLEIDVVGVMIGNEPLLPQKRESVVAPPDADPRMCVEQVDGLGPEFAASG